MSKPADTTPADAATTTAKGEVCPKCGKDEEKYKHEPLCRGCACRAVFPVPRPWSGRGIEPAAKLVGCLKVRVEGETHCEEHQCREPGCWIVPDLGRKFCCEHDYSGYYDLPNKRTWA